MERSPWDAKSHPTSPEILRILRNLNVHYRVHNSPQLVPILRKMHPVHNLPPYFPQIDPNIILQPTPMSSELSVPVRFFDPYFVSISHLTHAYYNPYARIRFPAGAGNFSLHHRVQNGSGAHPASYAMGTRGSFTEGKAAGT
jgi:hypothetical protein